jgi:hypothetical protein
MTLKEARLNLACSISLVLSLNKQMGIHQSQLWASSHYLLTPLQRSKHLHTASGVPDRRAVYSVKGRYQSWLLWGYYHVAEFIVRVVLHGHARIWVANRRPLPEFLQYEMW